MKFRQVQLLIAKRGVSSIISQSYWVIVKGGSDTDSDLRKKLSQEAGLKYVSQYNYPNGSVYKG